MKSMLAVGAVIVIFSLSSPWRVADGAVIDPALGSPQKRALAGGNSVAEEQLLKAVRKDQAVQLLRTTLDQSSAIPDLNERSLLVSRAAELLWRYDCEAARAALTKVFDELLNEYRKPEVAGSSQKLGEFEAALNRLLATLVHVDQSLADNRLKLLDQARTNNGRPANDPDKEKFSLAQQELNSDLGKSVKLAGRVLQNGVPFAFPQFLYDVRQADATVADNLYGQGLTILASGRVYRAVDAIQLSAYAFREGMVLFPTLNQDERGSRLQYGILTKKLSPPEYKPDPAITNGYLNAAYRYLSSQPSQGFPPDSNPTQLVQSLFLATKLSTYQARVGADSTGAWQQLRYDLEARCKNLGVDNATIQNLNGFAERLANNDDVFQFGDSTSFDRAKEVKDVQRRTQLFVRAIWNSIQGKRFAEAETRIRELDDREIRGKLTDLLGYYWARAEAGHDSWRTIDEKSATITDQRIRFVLLLDSARLAKSKGADSLPLATRFLMDARAIIPRLSDKTERLKSTVALASVASDIDPQLSEDAFADAITAINKSEEYDGDDLQVVVDVLPQFRVMLVLGHSDLESCVKREAQANWTNTLGQLQAVKSKRLKARFIIAACSAVL